MSKYSDDKKAEVMAALMAGQSVSAIARDYDIPKGTVSGWKKKVEPFYDIPEQNATQKGEIGDLILNYLRANLKALEQQVELFSEKDWLREQSASEAAVLHGVLTDKAIRLLEALGRAADGNDTES
jgi:transposase-like protein